MYRYRRLSLLVGAVFLFVLLGGGCTVQSKPSDGEYSPYFSTNQQIVEGFSSDTVNLNDTDVVFGYVFSQLPEQVIVYPSENYYYFQIYVDGRVVWGNIRIAAGYREQGIVSFAYFEFAEFSPLTTNFVRSKLYKEKDGVELKEIDPFTYTVRYEGKEVTFHLHQIPQEPPKQFLLDNNEVFVERTFDESGYQFFLIFNVKDNYFLWVLNEENEVPDILAPILDRRDIVIGRRSGFAFFVDAAHNNRKILASIRQHSVVRNDYYDGPFDQLADNYAEEAGVSEYMIKSYPALEGRIDMYGYYTDREQPLRVAITTYGTYYTQAQVIAFIDAAIASGDTYRHISRRGVPVASASDTESAES